MKCITFTGWDYNADTACREAANDFNAWLETASVYKDDLKIHVTSAAAYGPNDNAPLFMHAITVFYHEK